MFVQNNERPSCDPVDVQLMSETKNAQYMICVNYKSRPHLGFMALLPVVGYIAIPQ